MSALSLWRMWWGLLHVLDGLSLIATGGKWDARLTTRAAVAKAKRELGRARSQEKRSE